MACAIADGARAISDVRVMGDQWELFGPVASVPTVWRALTEIADGGARAAKKITAAVNTAAGMRGARSWHATARFRWYGSRTRPCTG